jgi:hypothetical protein
VNRPLILLVVLLAFGARQVLAGGSGPGALCSDDWYRYVDRQIVSGDGQGHGPDLGSDEWKGVVEFKLGIRGQPDLPVRDSDAWCELIDRLLRER